MANSTLDIAYNNAVWRLNYFCGQSTHEYYYIYEPAAANAITNNYPTYATKETPL